MKGSKWTQDPDVLVLIIGVLIILIWIVMQVREAS
jgi:flagellar biogenesis protein FliO